MTMTKCPRHKCNEYIYSFLSRKHQCKPLWDVVDVDEYDHTEDCWMEQRGHNEEDAVEQMCSDDCEFYDEQKEFIVRNPKTKKEVKVFIRAEPDINYRTRIEEFNPGDE